jgi:hypothetical protein
VFWAAFVVVGFLAPHASANPGTAGWIEIEILILGNLVIGLVEGGIAWGMGSRWWALPLMVVANYFSAWLGWNIIWAYDAYWGVFEGLGGEPLHDAVPAVWIVFAGLSAFGLVAEAPFYLLAFARSTRTKWKRAAVALLVANGVSIAGLGAFFGANMQTTLISEMRVVGSPGAVAADIEGERPWVYYIAPDDHTVRRVRPDGTGDEAVRRFESALGEVRLLAFQREGSLYSLGLSEWELDTPLAAELLAGRGLDEDEEFWSFLKIAPDVGRLAGVSEFDRENGGGSGAVSPFGPAADLRPEGERPFTVRSTWDGWIGMRLEGEGVPPALALDGPFIRRNLTPFGVTVLPGGVLVFELAHEWNGYHAGIYAASVRSRTIARLCDGRNPVVVYPHADPAD